MLRGLLITGTICAALIVAGLVLIVVGHSLPVFIVPFDQASAADVARCSDETRFNEAADARYLAMFGWHYAVQNAGVSLTAAGAAAALLAAALYRIPKSGIPWLRTPAHRWTFVAIGVGIVVGTVAGVWHGLWTDFTRHYFPWCADSMGIPLGGLVIAAENFTPILALAGAIVTLGFGTLPVPLNQWDANRPVWSWAITLVFAAVMIGGIALHLPTMLSSDLTSPMAVVTLYLLAATRAALLAPRR